MALQGDELKPEPSGPRVRITGLPVWMQPSLPESVGVAVVEVRSLQFNKRSCMAAVASQLKAVHPKRMRLRELQQATEFDAEDIGSCLVKLQRDDKVGKEAPPAAYKNGASYYWKGPIE